MPHNMYKPIECQETKRVKRLGMAIVAIAIALLLLSTRYHWIWTFFSSIYGLIIAGLIALFLIIKAVKAAGVQAYYNKYPWEQEGAERP